MGKDLYGCAVCGGWGSPRSPHIHSAVSGHQVGVAEYTYMYIVMMSRIYARVACAQDSFCTSFILSIEIIIRPFVIQISFEHVRHEHIRMDEYSESFDFLSARTNFGYLSAWIYVYV